MGDGSHRTSKRKVSTSLVDLFTCSMFGVLVLWLINSSATREQKLNFGRSTVLEVKTSPNFRLGVYVKIGDEIRRLSEQPSGAARSIALFPDEPHSSTYSVYLPDETFGKEDYVIVYWSDLPPEADQKPQIDWRIYGRINLPQGTPFSLRENSLAYKVLLSSLMNANSVPPIWSPLE